MPSLRFYTTAPVYLIAMCMCALAAISRVRRNLKPAWLSLFWQTYLLAFWRLREIGVVVLMWVWCLGETRHTIMSIMCSCMSSCYVTMTTWYKGNLKRGKINNDFMTYIFSSSLLVIKKHSSYNKSFIICSQYSWNKAA